MKKILQKRSVPVIVCALALLLLCKYLWSLFMFPGVPFGYDAGIYRYLFQKHAEGFPPFSVASMPPWASAHPLGLFFFSTILVRLGIPVDALIGWIWNVFPALVSLVFARVIGRRHGTAVGVIVLALFLLSTVQYQGFLMMYWKVFAALLFCVFAFDAFERSSAHWMFFGMMTIAIHQQIGLIFLVSTLAAILSHAGKHRQTRVVRIGLFLITALLGALWYVPNFGSSVIAVWASVRTSVPSSLAFLALFGGASLVALFAIVPTHRHFTILMLSCALGFILLLLPASGIAPAFLSRFLEGRSSVPGAFFTIPEYLESSLPLLLLGFLGLSFSFRKEKGSVWQFAAIFCFLFVFSLSFFYRRFLLPLDFFLLPFAALALQALWQKRLHALRLLCVVALGMQSWFAFVQVRDINPHVDPAMLTSFSRLPSIVESGRQVVVLDIMAPWVLGYLPDAYVSGPGIFDSQPLTAWEKFLYGTDAERSVFFAKYPKGTYFLATEVFRSYYSHDVLSLLVHPCLKPTSLSGLYISACGF